MDPLQKIATCCYCGTRAALVLSGEGRHELACARCGAPLHVLKQIKTAPPRPPKPKRIISSKSAKPAKPKPNRKAPKPERRRKRKGLGYWLREAFDELEDLFD